MNGGEPPEILQGAEDEAAIFNKRSELRLRIEDPTFLPTIDHIREAFYKPNPQYINQDWKRFCEQRDSNGFRRTYEVLNKDYIDALATYLAQEGERIGVSGRPLTVLEVGAGNGRLAHFLRESLDPEHMQYVATDNEFWEQKNPFPDDPVENMPYEKALAKYKPDIVIASWMQPMGDWTQAFRDTSSVQEYLLVGPVKARQGTFVTGNKDTWGNKYKKDGFQREELVDLSKLQISTNDYSVVENNSSKTFVFKRQPQAQTEAKAA